MSLQTRLKRLEKLGDVTDKMPACILRTIVKPGEDGPIECGAFATILKGDHAGLELECGETESREEFKARIDQLLENLG